MDKKNMLPEGTRDLILDECIIKRSLEREIDDIFGKWGYKEVITPTVEFYEAFNSNSQSLNEEDMYKFFDNKGRILVLRPDMTVPIARVAATKFKDSKFPLRLRYISNVFRVHESLGGKRNEYTDCGVECIGLNDKEADIEILVLALEGMKKLGLDDFKLEIGNIEFFNSAFEEMNLTIDDKNAIAKFIDNKNLKNLEDYLEALDIDDKYKEFLNNLPWMFGDKNVLEDAKKWAFNDEIKESLEYLESLYAQLDELGYGKNVTFDLGMIPRLNYYTGIIFRGYGEGVGNKVLTGGRYDKLVELKGEFVPAIGFSIDVNSIIPAVKDKKKLENISYKIMYSKNNVVKAIKKSEELRKQGFEVELVPSSDMDEIKIIKSGEC